MATYYISPSGNDNNNGSENSPFKTLNKAWTVVKAGDTVLLRGGTHAFSSQQTLTGKSGTSTNRIKVWAYEGEKPVLTSSNSYPQNGQDLIIFQGNWVHFKGLEISNHQRAGDWAAFRSENCKNCIFEQIDYHHNRMAFALRTNCTNNTILNCDFHHNKDSNDYNADGLGLNELAAGTKNYVIGCRAWNNSDDGFDAYYSKGFIEFSNCWFLYNGYENGTSNPTEGDGSGLKLGEVIASNSMLRTVKNCIGVKNKLWGINENNANCRMDIYNNTVAFNGNSNFYMGYWSGSQPQGNCKNNVSFSPVSTDFQSFGQMNVTHNSWQNGRNITANDFESIDETQLLAPRKADGSLPDVTCFKPKATSPLVDAGTNVQIPYYGTAPDIGAIELNQSVPAPNQLPVPNAGPDKQVTLPNGTVTLNGTATDPDGTIVLTQWKDDQGQVIGNSLNITIPHTVAGVYNYTLTVTDNDGATASDSAVVTIHPAPVSLQSFSYDTETKQLTVVYTDGTTQVIS